MVSLQSTQQRFALLGYSGVHLSNRDWTVIKPSSEVSICTQSEPCVCQIVVYMWLAVSPWLVVTGVKSRDEFQNFYHCTPTPSQAAPGQQGRDKINTFTNTPSSNRSQAIRIPSWKVNIFNHEIIFKTLVIQVFCYLKIQPLSMVNISLLIGHQISSSYCKAFSKNVELSICSQTC